MDDKAWLRRTAWLSDFSACGDMKSLKRFQDNIRNLVNERWVQIERLQFKLAESTGKSSETNSLRKTISDQITEVTFLESFLNPADWEERAAYVTRQLLELPLSLRYEVIANLEPLRDGDISASHTRSDEGKSQRVQLRISNEEHQLLEHLCRHSKQTISEVVRISILAYEPRFPLFDEMHTYKARRKLNSKLYVRLPAFLFAKLESQAQAHRTTKGATLRAMLRRWISQAQRSSEIFVES